MDAPWGALISEGGRITLYRVQGGQIAVQDFATREEAERSGIEAGRLICLDAALRTALPAPIFSLANGSLGAVEQAGPAARLHPQVRVLIAGALAEGPDWDGVVVVQDEGVTHWVHVSAREIVSCQGALTGRLAAAMGAVGDAVSDAALSDTISRPERLAVHLNAAVLTGDAATVLGHLIGAELAAMRPYWLGQDVKIIGQSAPYAAALAIQGAHADVVTRAKAWTAGIRALGNSAGFSA